MMAIAVIRPLIFLSLYLGSFRATGVAAFWQGDYTVMPFSFLLQLFLKSCALLCSNGRSQILTFCISTKEPLGAIY